LINISEYAKILIGEKIVVGSMVMIKPLNKISGIGFAINMEKYCEKPYRVVQVIENHSWGRVFYLRGGRCDSKMELWPWREEWIEKI